MIQSRLLAFLGVCCVFLSLIFSTTSAQADKLSYTAYVLPKHNAVKDGLEPYFEELRKKTNGSIDYQFHGGGSLASAKGTLKAVTDGIADSGLIVEAYHRKNLPINMAIVDLALLGTNALVVGNAVNETVLRQCPECLKAYEKNNVIHFGGYSTPPYHLMCKEPFKSLADAKGRKVRATGRHANWIRALGATPVSITGAEIYEALQRGQVDCTVGAEAWLRSYNLKDAGVKYVLDLPMGTYHGASLMNVNLDTWDSFSDEEKAAIKSGIPRLTRNVLESYVTETESVRSQYTQQGVEWVKPGQDIVDFLADFQKKEVENIKADVTEKKIKGGVEVIDRFLANLSKWEKIVNEEAQGDFDKLEAAMVREIYSKAP